MAESLVRFEARDGRISVDAPGAVVTVEHRTGPGLGYLGLGLPELDGTPLDPVSVAVDADEVEATLADGLGVGVVLRHTFVAGWQLRCVLTNAGATARTVRLRWPLTVDPAATGWGLAEGAEAELFVLPRRGDGPVLAGRLRQGALTEIDADGLGTPPLTLEPGGRYVLAWEWDWLPAPAAYARLRPTVHPVATIRTREETVRLPAGPDVALLAPEELGLETEPDGYDLTADRPGTYAVELRSARGLRTVDLTWTPTPQEVLAGAAAELLAGPRGRVGLPVLPGPAAAVVLQHAVAADLVDDLDEARDALDLYEARADLSGVRASLAALYLVGEHARTGEQDPLQAATERLRAVNKVQPGLGLVATRVCVARLLAGQSPEPVMSRLVELSTGLRPDGSSSPTSDGPIDPVAAAELLAVTRTSRTGRSDRPIAAHEETGPVAADLLSRLVLAAGTALGPGLPGGPLEPVGLDRLGHRLATLAAIPDQLSAGTRGAWGLAARELAELRVPLLLDRLAGPAPSNPSDRTAYEAGLVWLCLYLGVG